jgi:hypothetical protein
MPGMETYEPSAMGCDLRYPSAFEMATFAERLRSLRGQGIRRAAASR